MKFQTHNDADIDVIGTSLTGSIQATRKDLEWVFGIAGGNGGEDKLTTLWKIKFEDGTVVTIYDWRCPQPGLNQSYNWHIGSINRHGVQLVHNAFREALGFAARAA